MKVGDRVKLIGIPPDLRDDVKTRTLLEKCRGQSFPIADLETVERLPHQVAKLYVGHVLGEPD